MGDLPRPWLTAARCASAITSLLVLALIGVTASAVTASTTTASASAQGRGGIGSAFTQVVPPVALPSTSACYRSNTIRVQLHHSAGRRPVLVRLAVNGRSVDLHTHRIRYGAMFVGVPSRGHFTVSVTVRLGRGRAAHAITVRVGYHACTAA